MSSRIGAPMASAKHVPAMVIVLSLAAVVSAEAQELALAPSRGAGMGRPMLHQEYRLAPTVAPARYWPLRDRFRAQARTALRSAPSPRAGQVGQLAPGQTFQALAKVQDGDWILVGGPDGAGVGYVNAALVQSTAVRYPAY